MAYLAGNVVRFDISFTNTSTGALVDPTAVTFSYTVNGGPNLNPITYGAATVPAVGTIARLSTGLYETWISTIGIAGQVIGQWVSTGTGAAAVDDVIVVGQGPGTGNTFGDLIEKVYRRVMGGVRERTVQINQVGGIGSSDQTVVLSGPAVIGISPGVILAIDLELLMVQLWDPVALSATVYRGYLGSVSAAHSNGTMAYVNPRYSRFDIGVAINDDLRSLSSPTNGLFRVGVTSITANPVFSGYDLGSLPGNFIDILEVRYRVATPGRNFPAIRDWKVLRNVPDPSFPSGAGIVFYESGWAGLPMYVSYSAPFVPLVALSDSLFQTPGINDQAPPFSGYPTTTVANLTPTMLDLPPLGAEIDLTQPREISRNFLESQPDARKALEVVAGAIAGSVNALVARRAARISEEADRLMRQYTRSRKW
jgi:hypothetical protein